MTKTHHLDGMPSMAYLSLNPRGKYVFKCVVDQGPRFSGRRITIQLGTSDPALARYMRDKLLNGLIQAGCIIRRPRM